VFGVHLKPLALTVTLKLLLNGLGEEIMRMVLSVKPRPPVSLAQNVPETELLVVLIMVVCPFLLV